MQNFGVTNKEHYGMLWYFLEWSIIVVQNNGKENNVNKKCAARAKLFCG